MNILAYDFFTIYCMNFIICLCHVTLKLVSFPSSHQILSTPLVFLRHSVHVWSVCYRYYQDRGVEETVGVDTMTAMLQEQLKRNGFDDFTSIEHQCMHFDTNRSDHL